MCRCSCGTATHGSNSSDRLAERLLHARCGRCTRAAGEYSRLADGVYTLSLVLRVATVQDRAGGCCCIVCRACCLPARPIVFKRCVVNDRAYCVLRLRSTTCMVLSAACRQLVLLHLLHGDV